MKNYSWVKECFKKYGDEMTIALIKQQRAYEARHAKNNCEKCGKGNEGSIIESPSGNPLLVHYGLWTDNRCSFCGESRIQVDDYEGACNQ